MNWEMSNFLFWYENSIAEVVKVVKYKSNRSESECCFTFHQTSSPSKELKGIFHKQIILSFNLMDNRQAQMPYL